MADKVKEFAQYELPDMVSGETVAEQPRTNFTNYNLPDPGGAPISLGQETAAAHGSVTDNTIYQGGASQQSANFVPNTSGWFLSSTFGEFNFPLSVDALDIPDTVTAASFHVDSSGNSWWGAVLFANAPAKITAAGQATFTGVSLVNTFTAGENVSQGSLLCFKHKFACWGDDSSANRNTTAVMDSMVYVDQSNAATNYQASKDLCYVGINGGGSLLLTYLKLNLTGNPPGLPAWNEVDTVYLRLYVVFVAGASLGDFYLTRLTSAFTESTVTYNTRPTDDSVNWSVGKVVVESALNENNAATADGLATGYIDFDITEVYRLISQGTYTNNGFKLTCDNKFGSGAGTNVRFGGMTRAGGGTFNQAPFLVSYITKDNPGAGNTMTANDGKVYLASNSNYQRVKQLAGIAATTEVAGSSVKVHSLADGTLVPSSVLSVTNNQVYYLNSTTGTIGILTNNILEHDKWDLRIGIGSPNGLVIDRDKRPLFIRKFQSPNIVSSVTAITSCLAPPDATMAIAQWHVDAGAFENNGQLQVIKGFLTTAQSGSSDATVNQYQGTLAWSTGTAGIISLGIGGGGTSPVYTVYIYK